MGADVLGTQGARASATMIFTMLNQINLVTACQGLTLKDINELNHNKSQHIVPIFLVAYFIILMPVEFSQTASKPSRSDVSS